MGNAVGDIRTDGEEYQEVAWPTEDIKRASLGNHLAKIEFFDQGEYIYNFRFTCVNGKQSGLLGFEEQEPNTTFDVPRDVKIAKVRACFEEGKDWQKNARYYLCQFELIDDNGNSIFSGGKNQKKEEHWLEAELPEDETLIGLRVVKCSGY